MNETEKKQPWFIQMKGVIKPKEEDQEHVKDFEGNGFRGKQESEFN